MNGLLYLDSADASESQEALEMGYVAGVTTNPTLMARAGREPLSVLRDLLAVKDWPVFYQPGAISPAGALDEACAAFALAPNQVVVKLPATKWAFPVAVMLGSRGCRVSITAVYTPAQAVLAAAVGAESVIVYVDRARRLLTEGGADVTRSISALLAARNLELGIVAASVRSRVQVEQAFLDGADIVTAPLSVLKELPLHELTEDAVARFASDAQNAARASLTSRRISAG